MANENIDPRTLPRMEDLATKSKRNSLQRPLSASASSNRHSKRNSIPPQPMRMTITTPSNNADASNTNSRHLLTPPPSQDEDWSNQMDMSENGDSEPSHIRSPSRKRGRVNANQSQGSSTPNPKPRKQSRTASSIPRDRVPDSAPASTSTLLSRAAKRTRQVETAGQTQSPNPRARKQARVTPDHAHSTPKRKSHITRVKEEGRGLSPSLSWIGTRRMSTPLRMSPPIIDLTVSPPPGSPSDDPMLLVGNVPRPRHEARLSHEPVTDSIAEEDIKSEEEDRLPLPQHHKQPPLPAPNFGILVDDVPSEPLLDDIFNEPDHDHEDSDLDSDSGSNPDMGFLGEYDIPIRQCTLSPPSEARRRNSVVGRRRPTPHKLILDGEGDLSAMAKSGYFDAENYDDASDASYSPPPEQAAHEAPPPLILAGLDDDEAQPPSDVSGYINDPVGFQVLEEILDTDAEPKVEDQDPTPLPNDFGMQEQHLTPSVESQPESVPFISQPVTQEDSAQEEPSPDRSVEEEIKDHVRDNSVHDEPIQIERTVDSDEEDQWGDSLDQHQPDFEPTIVYHPGDDHGPIPDDWVADGPSRVLDDDETSAATASPNRLTRENPEPPSSDEDEAIASQEREDPGRNASPLMTFNPIVRLSAGPAPSIHGLDGEASDDDDEEAAEVERSVSRGLGDKVEPSYIQIPTIVLPKEEDEISPRGSPYLNGSHPVDEDEELEDFAQKVTQTISYPKLPTRATQSSNPPPWVSQGRDGYMSGPATVAVRMTEEDEGSNSDDDRYVEITSKDPKAAAKAAAILKMHHSYLVDEGEFVPNRSQIPHREQSRQRLLHPPETTLAAPSRSRSRSRSDLAAHNVSLPDLLHEAEAKVLNDSLRHDSMRAMSPTKNKGKRVADPDESTTNILAGLTKSRPLAPHRTARSAPSVHRSWGKDDWKNMERCFVRARKDIAALEGLESSKEVHPGAVDLEDIVTRFLGILARSNPRPSGPDFEQESLLRRAEALQLRLLSIDGAERHIVPRTRAVTPLTSRRQIVPETPSTFGDDHDYDTVSQSRSRSRSISTRPLPPVLHAPQYAHLQKKATAIGRRHAAASQQASNQLAAQQKPKEEISPDTSNLTSSGSNSSLTSRLLGLFSFRSSEAHIPDQQKPMRMQTASKLPQPMKPRPFQPPTTKPPPRGPIATSTPGAGPSNSRVANNTARGAPISIPVRNASTASTRDYAVSINSEYEEFPTLNHVVPSTRSVPAARSIKLPALKPVNTRAIAIPSTRKNPELRKVNSSSSVKDLVRSFEEMDSSRSGEELRRMGSDTSMRSSYSRQSHSRSGDRSMDTSHSSENSRSRVDRSGGDDEIVEGPPSVKFVRQAQAPSSAPKRRMTFLDRPF